MSSTGSEQFPRQRAAHGRTERSTGVVTASAAVSSSHRACMHGATRRALALLLRAGMAERSDVRLPVVPPPRSVGLWHGYDRLPRR